MILTNARRKRKVSYPEIIEDFTFIVLFAINFRIKFIKNIVRHNHVEIDLTTVL